MLPGAGTSALLDVELTRALTADQTPLLAKQLLTLKKYVVQVDTTAAPLGEPSDDEEPVEAQEEMAPLNLSDDDLPRDLSDQDEEGNAKTARVTLSPHLRRCDWGAQMK